MSIGEGDRLVILAADEVYIGINVKDPEEASEAQYRAYLDVYDCEGVALTKQSVYIIKDRVIYVYSREDSEKKLGEYHNLFDPCCVTLKRSGGM